MSGVGRRPTDDESDVCVVVVVEGHRGEAVTDGPVDDAGHVRPARRSGCCERLHGGGECVHLRVERGDGALCPEGVDVGCSDMPSGRDRGVAGAGEHLRPHAVDDVLLVLWGHVVLLRRWDGEQPRRHRGGGHSLQDPGIDDVSGAVRGDAVSVAAFGERAALEAHEVVVEPPHPGEHRRGRLLAAGDHELHTEARAVVAGAVRPGTFQPAALDEAGVPADEGVVADVLPRPFRGWLVLVVVLPLTDLLEAFRARAYMDTGDYVPDRVTNEMVRDRLSQNDTPRTVGCSTDTPEPLRRSTSSTVSAGGPVRLSTWCSSCTLPRRSSCEDLSSGRRRKGARTTPRR